MSPAPPTSPPSPPEIAARIRALRARGQQAAHAMDLELAHELYDAGHVLGEAAGSFDAAAECMAGLGLVAQHRNQNQLARQLYTTALPRLHDPVVRQTVRIGHAFAHYDEGHTHEARAELELLLTEALPAALHARVRGYLGNVARAEGRLHDARRLYAESLAALASLGDYKFYVTFTMDTAIASLLAGDPGSAAAHLAAVRDRPELGENTYLASLVHHYDALAQLRLGLPWQGVWSEDDGPLPLNRFLTRLRSGLEAPAEALLAELQADAPANAHARISLDVAAAIQLDRSRVQPSLGLTVARSGAFFRLQNQPAVLLGQRLPLMRLVRELGVARMERPGSFVDGERLVENAWPGERLLPAARKNRLHVALSTLRTLGLRPVLQSHAGGYRIDPDVATVLTA